MSTKPFAPPGRRGSAVFSDAARRGAPGAVVEGDQVDRVQYSVTPQGVEHVCDFGPEFGGLLRAVFSDAARR